MSNRFHFKESSRRVYCVTIKHPSSADFKFNFLVFDERANKPTQKGAELIKFNEFFILCFHPRAHFLVAVKRLAQQPLSSLIIINILDYRFTSNSILIDLSHFTVYNFKWFQMANLFGNNWFGVCSPQRDSHFLNVDKQNPRKAAKQ